MENSKLRDAIRNRNNPNAGGYEQQLQALITKYEQEFQRVIEEAKKTLASSSESTLFSSMEPVKKLATESAQTEIKNFQKDTTQRITDVMKALEQQKQDIMAKVEEEIQAVRNEFEGELRDLLSGTSQRADQMFQDQGTQFETSLADMKQKAQYFKGDKGDTGDKGADGKNPDPNVVAKIVMKQVPKADAVADMVMERIPKPKEVSPKQMARGLETLTGDERLDKSAIKGLSEEFTGIQRQIREQRGGGGGGIGNFQHETKNVSSATTSITTNYKIGGGGFAVWAFYEGALIVRGTAYTVNADHKTLPLQFVPDDGTHIDIIYVRG